MNRLPHNEADFDISSSTNSFSSAGRQQYSLASFSTRMAFMAQATSRPGCGDRADP